MIVGIIPARFASTRLMGKPIADIDGKPLIIHTYESAKKSKLLNDVIIAVDDKKIYDVVKSFGAKVKLTPKELPTGTDRVAFVAEGMNADIFVNIQGDQPFVPSRMIDEAIEPFLFDKEVNISTVAKQITTVDELKSTSIPKVVFDYNNYALYFSRTAIPFVKEARTNLAKVQSTEVYKHIGVYVYRKSVLERLLSLKQTDLEKIEKLEQLRLLEHGFKVKIVVTDYECFSVHTPNDLEIARNYYKKIIKPKNVEE